MDTLQNAPTSNKLINYRPIAEIAVGLMLGIAVCGIMPAGGAAVLCIMTACGAAGVVFALLRHTRSALFAASVLVGILFAALRLPTELPNGNYTVSGIVLSAEYSDGGNGTHSHKKRAAFICICGSFPQGRQGENHNGRLFKHRCRRQRLHSESLSSRSGKGRFVGTEQIPETAFGGYNGIGKVIRRRFER